LNSFRTKTPKGTDLFLSEKISSYQPLFSIAGTAQQYRNYNNCEKPGSAPQRPN